MGISDDAAANMLGGRFPGGSEAWDATSKRKLSELVAHIEKMQAVVDDAKEQVKAAYSAANAMGLDTTALKEVIDARRKDQGEGERDDRRAMFDLYWDAVEDGARS